MHPGDIKCLKMLSPGSKKRRFRYKSKREQDKALDRSDPSDEDDNKKPVQGPSSDSDVQRPRRSNIRVQRIAKYQEPVVEPIIGAELKTKTPVGKAKGYVNPTSTLKKEAACFDDRAATSLALAKYDEEFAEYLRDPLNFDRRSPGSAKKPSSSKVQPRKSRKSSSSTSEAVDVSSSQRKTAGKSGRASRSSSDSTESRRPKKSHRLRQETLIGKSAKKRKEKATRVRSKSSSHDSSASIKSRRRKKSHGLKQLTLIGKPSEPRKQKKAKDINNLASVVKPARQGRSRIRSKLSQHGLRHRRSKSNASSTTSKKLATRKKHGKPSMYSNYKKMLEMQSKSRKIESKLDKTAKKSSTKSAPKKSRNEPQ
uniref:Serine/arginine repetitive matrix protein 2 n=1 Tax=Bursaphelenchus xylophilus TaxID=6326 RepID=A0A1I7SIQ3_BURXY